MHQKNITFPDIRKDIIVIHQCRNRLRRIFRCLQMIVSVKSVHLHKDRQIQSARNLEDVFLVDFQLPFQYLEESLIRLILDLQTDDLAPLPAL